MRNFLQFAEFQDSKRIIKQETCMTAKGQGKRKKQNENLAKIKKTFFDRKIHACGIISLQKDAGSGC